MNCPHKTPTNPNESPAPTLQMDEPDYSTSKSMIYKKGADWVRTGFCIDCDAAIYGKRPIGQLEIDPETPLHHAIKKTKMQTPQIEPLAGMSSLGLRDSRKSQAFIDAKERRDKMAELQAQPLTAPAVDHPEMFPEALADEEGQGMLF